MYQEISYEIVIFYHICGGGLAYEHLWQETFAAGAVFRSSALCLFQLFLDGIWKGAELFGIMVKYTPLQ